MPRTLRLKIIFSLFFLTSLKTFSQDNSPYSRYGLGNEFSRTNIINRGMGGVSAADTSSLSINFSNPASYARFQAHTEKRSGKMDAGRVILDVGLNIANRKLTVPNTTRSFTTSDALFSHVYIGFPLKKNWGLSFGIRPLSRISYNIYRTERLKDPVTNLPIDSVESQFSGNGGSFLPTIGTGFGGRDFSIGVNVGYLFGRKEITTRRVFINDSVEYAASNHTTNTSYGNIFFNVGAQYKIDLSAGSSLRLGVTGNWKQNLDGKQDLLRQTFTRDANGAELQIDSVFQQSDVEGVVVYPASYTAGFIYEKAATEKRRGWSFGVDWVQNKWDQFRFYGATDSVKNNSEVRVGFQLTPMTVSTRYGQAISYRLGFFTGNDYIRVKSKIPTFGVTAGVSLPIRNYNRISINQFSVVNLGFEYIRRGDDSNILKENMFRFSVGFNFTDLWFMKRRYE